MAIIYRGVNETLIYKERGHKWAGSDPETTKYNLNWKQILVKNVFRSCSLLSALLVLGFIAVQESAINVEKKI